MNAATPGLPARARFNLAWVAGLLLLKGPLGLLPGALVGGVFLPIGFLKFKAGKRAAALGAQPSSVMGDDTYVYFADFSGAVNVAAIHGGDAVQLAKGPTGKVSMAMDQSSIYFANSNDDAIIAMPRQ